jgi:hypothetical protein
MSFFIPGPQQLRDARRLAGIGQPALAQMIGKSLDVTRRAEAAGNVSSDNLRTIIETLIGAGIEFRPDGSVARRESAA